MKSIVQNSPSIREVTLALILYYLALVGPIIGQVLQPLLNTALLLSIYCVAVILFRLQFTQKENNKLNYNPSIFKALLLIAVIMLLFCAHDSFNPNSVRRGIIWILPPFSYIAFCNVPTITISRAALYALVLYLIFHIHTLNSQIFIINTGAFIFLLISSQRKKNMAFFMFGGVLSMYLGSMGALISFVFAIIISIPRALKNLHLVTAAIILILISAKSILSMRSIQYRWYFWEIAIEKFLNHPILGNGLGVSYPIYDDRLLPHSHNFYISILSETGLLGGLCFLYLGFVIFSKRYYLSQATLVALSAFLLWNCFDEPFYWSLPVAATGILLTRIRAETTSMIDKIEQC